MSIAATIARKAREAAGSPKGYCIGAIKQWNRDVPRKKKSAILQKQKRRNPRPKAIWMQAFPAQVDNHMAEHTAAEKRLHRKEARAFVEAAVARGETCPVVAAIPELRNGRKYGHRISAKLNEVHHLFGRRNKLLRWQPGWMAISKQGHRWLHAHTKEAKARGWLAPGGIWNDYERAETFLTRNGSTLPPNPQMSLL